MGNEKDPIRNRSHSSAQKACRWDHPPEYIVCYMLILTESLNAGSSLGNTLYVTIPCTQNVYDTGKEERKQKRSTVQQRFNSCLPRYIMGVVILYLLVVHELLGCCSILESTIIDCLTTPTSTHSHGCLL